MPIRRPRHSPSRSAFPPESFDVNLNSWQAKGLQVWIPAPASRGGEVARGKVKNIDVAFNGSLDTVPSPESGHEISFPTTGSPYGHITRDIAFGTAGTIVFAGVYANFGAADGNFYLFDTQATRSLMLKNGGSDSYTFFMHGTALSNVNSFLNLNAYTDAIITWDNNRSSNRVRLFKDGVQHYTVNNSLTGYTNTDIYLGARFNLLEFWRGAIGEFRFYDYAWDAAQAWDLSYRGRWDLYLPEKRLWAVKAPVAAGVNAPTSHLLGPLYGPLGGPIG